MRTLSFILMIISSLCYLIIMGVIIRAGEASGYLLYLNIIFGLLFIVLAWYRFYKNRPKKETQSIK